MNTLGISPNPQSARANRDQHGPLLEPLISKIIEIGRLLDELHDLTAAKTDEIKVLYKAATLLTRKKAARHLSISESQLDRESGKGALNEISIDRRPRFCLIDLESYIASRRTTRRKRLSVVKPEPIRGGTDKGGAKRATPPRRRLK